MSGRLQATACAGLLCISLGAAGQEDAPGWTGITNVDDLIAARQALMGEIERLMLPIDLYTVGEQEDIEEIHSAATSIAQMLVATPHLFPPTTNLYDAEAEFPKTIAMPAVWENFSTFYSMANAASETASELGAAGTPEALREGAVALRASCDACHALFMLPYEPPSVSSEDLDFDFDALFENIENANSESE